VPNQAIDHRVRVTLSNSFGFGGSNTSLVLRRAA
jgi:3-oxoacyl-(acyl-carrier-protein) synthase